MVPHKYYQDLDITKLKTRAHRWASMHRCIERIYLYLYDIDSEDDTYEYVIVFVAPERNSNEYVDRDGLDRYYDWVNDGISNIQKDFEKFYKPGHRAGEGEWMPEVDDGLPEDEWMLYSVTNLEATDINGYLNFYGEDPFINLESELLLFSRTENDKASQDECFPALNTEYLKKIVARWVEQYSHRGMTTDSVILYHYDPGLLKQSMSGTRYALVFNLDHEYTISLEDLKDIETATSSIILDPYLWFAKETGFFSNAEIEGLPEMFRNNDFEFVYKHPRHSFHKEWMLIPLFNGYEMPGGVRVNEGQVTIYSGSSSSFNPYRPPSKDNLNAIFLKNKETILNKAKNEDIQDIEPQTNNIKESGTSESHPTAPKLSPLQKDRKKCIEIAKKTWDKFPELRINYILKHPEILSITGGKYTLYKERTVRTWIKNDAPKDIRSQGRPSKEVKKEQEKICKKIGIKI